ncbi:MAG: ion transporter [Chitinophagaceae bacterium]|nr:MAG: ion transporter [Chitinophagaceae bacterium]
MSSIIQPSRRRERSFGQRLKQWLGIIVFGTTTKMGRAFDIGLLWAILISILIIIVESVPAVNAKYGFYLKTAEWIITILFTLEYIIRIWVVKKKSGYIFSFFGMIDFLSIASFYLSLVFPGSKPFILLRAIRLLRIFRIFQLTHYLSESAIMGKALIKSLKRITVFLSVLVVAVIILGTIMYVIEHEDNPGFHTIPQSIYWAIVTITTVGYGDVTPVTYFGKVLSSIIMMLGYALIAVPTGIVAAELTKQKDEDVFHHQKRVGECPSCGLDIYDPNANYCRNCGKPLPEEAISTVERPVAES